MPRLCQPCFHRPRHGRHGRGTAFSDKAKYRMDEDFSPPKHFALLAAVFEGVLAVAAIGLGWLVGQRPMEMLRWNLADAGWGTAATLLPLAMLWVCLKCPWRPFVELVRVVDELLVPMFRGCRLPELAVISVLAGLGEELLFRGVVQAAVADWMGGQIGVWIGLAVAAVLFGLAHPMTFTYALLAALIGLYLGWIWIAADYNLLVPVVTHAVYDFLALVYLVKLRRPFVV